MTAIDAILAGHDRRGDECAIAFTDHAIERFAERLGRDLDLAEVRRQLSLMLATATVTSTPPAWYRGDHSRAIAFLILGDILQPLVRQKDELVATTTLFEGLLTDEAVEYRRAQQLDERRCQRARRRGAKRKGRAS